MSLFLPYLPHPSPTITQCSYKMGGKAEETSPPAVSLYWSSIGVYTWHETNGHIQSNREEHTWVVQTRGHANSSISILNNNNFKDNLKIVKKKI